MSQPHPLLDVLSAAATGRYPSVDGAVEVLPPWTPGLRAVVSFTGHAYVVTEQSPAEFADAFADLAPDGFGRALDPAVLLRLAGPRGEIGVLDATLALRTPAAAPTGARSPLTRRPDLTDHPRVAHARAIRTGVEVYADDRGLVTLGRGLAGRRELSIEVAAALQGNRVGPSLLADGLGLVPSGELVFAAVSPGNVRSLRLFLAAGFSPIGSEVIIRLPAPPPHTVRT